MEHTVKGGDVTLFHFTPRRETPQKKTKEQSYERRHQEQQPLFDAQRAQDQEAKKTTRHLRSPEKQQRSSKLFLACFRAELSGKSPPLLGFAMSFLLSASDVRWVKRMHKEPRLTDTAKNDHAATARCSLFIKNRFNSKTMEIWQILTTRERVKQTSCALQ